MSPVEVPGLKVLAEPTPTSAAKAAGEKLLVYGTAEAVPLSKTVLQQS
jgi:hypothetical protein